MRALLTGASSGIGEALASLLASKGYTLILSSRTVGIVADLATKEGRQKLTDVIRKEIPDLLINCAGYGKYGEMGETPVAEQMAILEVNAVAPIELTLEFVRTLITAQKGGVVLNVSSIAGDFPAPGMGLYGSAKACLTHFSRTLNTEVAPRGIHVLVSCPGMVATPFATRAAKKKIVARGMTPEYAAQEIWKQIESLQERRTFNWFYRLARLVPPGLVKKMIWRDIKKRL